MANEFNKGREYERKQDSMRFHFFLGYGCVIGSIIFSVGYFFNPTKTNIYTSLLILLFGLLSLYLAYSEKKELKKLRWKSIYLKLIAAIVKGHNKF